jgi:hypothetical protein
MPRTSESDRVPGKDSLIMVRDVAAVNSMVRIEITASLTAMPFIFFRLVCLDSSDGSLNYIQYITVPGQRVSHMMSL